MMKVYMEDLRPVFLIFESSTAHLHIYECILFPLFFLKVDVISNLKIIFIHVDFSFFYCACMQCY